MTKVGIIGAGPAGMIAAIAASQMRMDVTVFEQAPDISPAGAGIAIQLNGLRVLEELGILDGFDQLARRVPRAFAETPHGKVLATADSVAAILRKDLQVFLHNEATKAGARVQFAKRCASVGREGNVVFQDGDCARFDVVIGADGINSVVRGSLEFRAKRRSIGYAGVRAVANFVPTDDDLHEFWGPGGRFFLIVPLRNGQTYFSCTAPRAGFASMSPLDVERWLEGWRDYPPDVCSLIAAVDSWDALRYDEIEEVVVRRWHEGKVVLIGDAAHAMAPNLGQGANCAMVDAVVLMRELARTGSVEEAAIAYESARRRAVTRIQRVSRAGGRTQHWSSPVAQAFRNTAMHILDRSLIVRRLQRQLLTG